MKIIISEDKMSNALERAINKELKNLKDLSESEDFDMESLPDNISWDTMNWIDYVEKIEVVQVHKDINPNPQFTSFNVLINVYTNYLTFFDVEPIISNLEDLVNDTLNINISLVENEVINNGEEKPWENESDN